MTIKYIYPSKVWAIRIVTIIFALIYVQALYVLVHAFFMDTSNVVTFMTMIFVMITGLDFVMGFQKLERQYYINADEYCPHCFEKKACPRQRAMIR